MAIEAVSPPSGAAGVSKGEGSRQGFGEVMGGARKGGVGKVSGESAPRLVVQAEPKAKPGCPARVGGLDPARAVEQVSASRNVDRVSAAKMVDAVTAAQTRLDRVMQLAQSGKSFTPAELLALQAHVYRASQELDLAGKVVEKATAGVKQVLQTQV